ncbi:MAG: serine/threonine protein kinase [Microscillaceae bacterium]|nr:serine/threonine protein kinase [Microscillaceae bacterium]
MLGQQILNYRITAKIGEGGMGSVFKAQHTQLDRPAAIKALHPNLVSNAMIRERFKNEAATMAHLRHPNIVSLYDYLETPQGLFLIMEFVEGYPLDRYIQEVSGPIPEARALALFTKILEGFAYAHQQGVVHRDIKPSNLIISADGQEVKILDFGIAKLLDGSTKNLTKTGSRMGTVLYMSPEQVKGGMLDQRSDIYSLGVTLFQMLTGRCPYDEATATEYEVYHQIVNFPLPRLQEFYPGVSSRMQALIDRATAKNPEDRFASCDEFKAALLGQTALPKQSPALQKPRRFLRLPFLRPKGGLPRDRGGAKMAGFGPRPYFYALPWWV